MYYKQYLSTHSLIRHSGKMTYFKPKSFFCADSRQVPVLSFGNYDAQNIRPDLSCVPRKMQNRVQCKLGCVKVQHNRIYLVALHLMLASQVKYLKHYCGLHDSFKRRNVGSKATSSKGSLTPGVTAFWLNHD